MNIILLSGGSGKRLWPLSNNIRSKQFLKIFKKEDGTSESMLQRVYRMIKSVDSQASITIATSESQTGIILSQLEDAVNISIEPCRRDTFPAIALATAYLCDVLHISRNETVVVCPVDSYVNEEFFHMLNKLDEKAKKGDAKLVLMGIDPIYPSAKYGYIIPKTIDDESMVESFREKPTEEEARELIKRGALWNGGIFAYKLSYVLDKSRELLGTDSYAELFNNYDYTTKISFDYAVVENEQSISVLRFHGEWKDLGTWNTLTESMSEKVVGKAIAEKCENIHIINELHIPLIALGVKDLVIAATPDGMLVSDKYMSSNLKDYVEDQRPMVEERLWGEYEVYDYRNTVVKDKNNKATSTNQSLTKHLLIKAGKCISYQRHNHRMENWVVIEGEGEVVIDGSTRDIHRGDIVIIPLGTKHGVKATTDLHIIEVQIGADLAEEDIERFDWDWSPNDRFEHWKKAGFMLEELSLMDNYDIEEAFASDLNFGTGGLRAKMGAGTNRMNSFTVAKVSKGIANYLNKNYENPSIVIAYDTRHHSKEFATVAASIFCNNGIKAQIFPEPVPTPLLSYTLSNYSYSAGIVITASHNSKEYNGYKVYNEKGCQITDDVAKGIKKEIDTVDLYNVDFNSHYQNFYVPDVVGNNYLESVKRASFVKDNGSNHNLRVLYSSLNGTGLNYVVNSLRLAGFHNVFTVPEHEAFDGNFTTCPYPNPESQKVLEYCVPCAMNYQVDIIIATDPDGDRIGVMCAVGMEYKRLNPNEVGVLMLDFICKKRNIYNRDAEKAKYTPVFLKTIVTTSMAEKIANQYGIKTINTLTGFKYIGEQIHGLKPGEMFIFGMEESCGYLSNRDLLDKDGINASVLLCEMAQEYKNQGITLYERMQELYRDYGYYINSQENYKFNEVDYELYIKSIMDRFCIPLTDLEEMKVIECIDYSEGYKGLPATNMREYKMDDGSRFLIRPSGTEPKLKVYVETVSDDFTKAKEKNQKIHEYIKCLIK